MPYACLRYTHVYTNIRPFSKWFDKDQKQFRTRERKQNEMETCLYNCYWRSSLLNLLSPGLLSRKHDGKFEVRDQQFVSSFFLYSLEIFISLIHLLLLSVSVSLFSFVIFCFRLFGWGDEESGFIHTLVGVNRIEWQRLCSHLHRYFIVHFVNTGCRSLATGLLGQRWTPWFLLAVFHHTIRRIHRYRPIVNVRCRRIDPWSGWWGIQRFVVSVWWATFFIGKEKTRQLVSQLWNG